MIAICHKCGSRKTLPTTNCQVCGNTPVGQEELALSIMLTDRFLDEDKLTEVSRAIQSGQRIEVPPTIRAAMFAGIQASECSRPPSSEWPLSHKLWTGGIIAGILIFVFLVTNPSLHYQWAALLDTVESYENFSRKFPRAVHVQSAKQRIKELKEPEIWDNAQKSNEIEAYRFYIKEYSQGDHVDEAKEKAVQLADQVWEKIKDSRSDQRIIDFIENYPETTKLSSAKERIEELFSDWDWVREQNQLNHYQRFLSNNPNHAEAEWIKKRIIDLEVALIAEGDYGTFEEPERIAYGGTTAIVEIHNQTKYSLTVRYSGVRESKIITIGMREIAEIDLIPGEYKVAASVDAENVKNYYGKSYMTVGRFKSSFQIMTYKSRNTFPFIRD